MTGGTQAELELHEEVYSIIRCNISVNPELKSHVIGQLLYEVLRPYMLREEMKRCCNQERNRNEALHPHSLQIMGKVYRPKVLSPSEILQNLYTCEIGIYSYNQ
jgi:hypothetical protein